MIRFIKAEVKRNDFKNRLKTLPAAKGSRKHVLPAYNLLLLAISTRLFPDSVLEQSGLPAMKIPASERRYTQGLWVGIYRDPKTGKLKAAAPLYATGTEDRQRLNTYA